MTVRKEGIRLLVTLYLGICDHLLEFLHGSIGTSKQKRCTEIFIGFSSVNLSPRGKILAPKGEV
jgi:hypothetical protein